MELTVTARSINISGQSTYEMEAYLFSVDVDEILDQIDPQDVVEHYGDDDLLEHMDTNNLLETAGIDAAMRYFGLVEA